MADDLMSEISMIVPPSAPDSYIGAGSSANRKSFGAKKDSVDFTIKIYKGKIG